jgi:hypothetical protein
MALPTAAWVTYSAVGIREDLSDVIYDISPTETPFVSNLPRVNASNTLHDWQMDNLAAANTANAALEGDDHSGAALTPTQKLRNYTQIFRKDIVVTGTMRAVNPAGRADELDYHTARTGKELKRDIEAVFLEAHSATAGSAATGRGLVGVKAWLGSASTNGIQYPYANAGTSTTGATTPGFASATGLVTTAPTAASSGGTPTVANLNSVIRQAWTNGGDPRTVMCGPFNKTVISGFTGIATLQRDVNGLKQGVIVGAADVYVSDFGVHTIVPNRFAREDTIYVLDMEYWANAELRPMMTVPIAKTGDSDKIMMLSETTLECRNPFASGKVADCSTS